MISIQKFVFNPFQVNSYLLFNTEGDAVVVDPACHSSEEEEILFSFIESRKLDVQAIINTHCHVDHLPGVEAVRKKFDTGFYCHREDEFLIDSSEEHGAMFGFSVSKPAPPDGYIGGGEERIFKRLKISFLHIPGHSPGSLVLRLPEEKILITGDVLFAGSIGRTDLPGGDYDLLIQGIQGKLLQLDGGYRVLPGHGPQTTIAEEKLNNPFLQ